MFSKDTYIQRREILKKNFSSGTILFMGNDYTIDDIVWMGDMPSVASLARESGIEQTAGTDELKSKLEKSGQVLFLPPYRPEHQIKLFQLLKINPAEAAQKASIPLAVAIAKPGMTEAQVAAKVSFFCSMPGRNLQWVMPAI